jgi:preflagellin peptidase FlaK
MFSYLRKALCLIMLTISSYEDFKTREVDDRIWLIFSPIGILITLIEYFFKFIDFSYLILYFISILITTIISIIIYYSKFVGGADSKALISISFLDPINLNKNIIHPFVPIIVLTNSCIISLIIPLFLFTYNLFRILNKEKIFEGFENEKLYRKIFALFIGYRTKGIKKRFAIPIEDGFGEKREFFFTPLLMLDVEPIENEGEWVSPCLPLIVFILIGYIINILYGDILKIFFKNFNFLKNTI